LSDAPFLLVIAGPNGSGKSTLTNFLSDLGYDFGTYINPDEIAAEIDLPEAQRSLHAQSLADLARERCLAERISFSFETVMSHPSKLEFMSRARDAGYVVELFFVCTSDPAINVVRVRHRVHFGGHDVPQDRIFARYRRTLDLLPRAAVLSHRVRLFDNTAELEADPWPEPSARKKGLRAVADLIIDGSDWKLTIEGNPPRWVVEHLVEPLQKMALESTGEVALHISQRPDAL